MWKEHHQNIYKAPFFLQWLPHQWKYQLMYLCYRWVVMLYFLIWLIITIFQATKFIKFKYLIFLTHWSFIAWNSYLVFSAITTTMAVCQEERKQELEDDHSNHDFTSAEKSTSCSGREVGQTALTTRFKIQWVLFMIGGEYAVTISVLYWSLFYSPNSEQNLYSLDSLHVHLINGIFAIIEVWISGIPVRLYHAVYSIAFGFVYILFTVVYYAAEGRDPNGNRFIYPFLDYGCHPRAAVVVALTCAVLFVGSMHLVFFLQYMVRQSITNLLYQHHHNDHHHCHHHHHHEQH